MHTRALRTALGAAGLIAVLALASVSAAPLPLRQQRPVALAALGAKAPAALAYAAPTPRVITQKLCLSWRYFTGQPWTCSHWYLMRGQHLATLGTATYQWRQSRWQRIPYDFSSNTKIATYNYRLDTALQHKAYTSLGSSNSYDFYSVAGGTAISHTPSVLWPCNPTIGWTVDFTGTKGTPLNHAVELARWTKAFATVAAVPGVNVAFKYVGESTFVASELHPAFTDGHIHITYSAASGTYHSTRITTELGFGGLSWKSNADRTVSEGINYAYVLIDSAKVANMIAWPSPNKPAKVDQVLTLYMHELGHALGLAHTNDKYQVMYPYIQPEIADRWGAGDTAALKQLFAPKPCPSPSS